ncbi:carbohydrate ABC transporter permease [Waterburya agarophytonicola K14]|uniref:Carbohydrate ABC transporter permease n=1 Tax=Waterburya agarophytonicola KI4 TaxID=2874699 RepID=A0A964FHH6_9CYAN|nr:carbohydrate ABC transporter permease [Waterburya agarophytonicola]MCC0177508.1 carbohydrate ABC transporter permease [Waterburya agarophytonicola KI4]
MSSVQSKKEAGSFPRTKVWLWISVVLIAVFFAAPILWQILTSVKLNEDITAIPNVYFPSKFTVEHYQSLFSRRPFLAYIFNSAFVASISTILCLVVGSPAAYGLARMNLPGEKLILTGILIVTLFPYVLLFLGLLEIVKAVGLGNNYLALILPYTAINLPLTILVMRSFFLQLPKDLEDAAKIDGYKTWGMLVNIVLPMTLPALATTGILTFIFAWNEYIFALTFITEEAKKTIPVATAQLGSANLFDIPYGSIAAATVLGTLPLVILVLIFQRQIVQGLTAGAVKG